MAESDQPDESQKTEDPTPRRLEEAHKKGNVPMSKELNTWLMLLAGTMIIIIWSPTLITRIAIIGQAFLEHSYSLPISALGQGAKEILLIMAAPFGFLMVIGFFAPFAQIGPLFSIEPIIPKPSKVSPLSGLKRLFSSQSLFEFLKGLMKISAISIAGYIAIAPFFDGVESMVGMPAPSILHDTLFLARKMLIVILIVLLVMAVADLAYTRFSYYKKMRMSKQEIKDELRQSEGDPMVRARLRALRSEKSRKRMMAAVPDADVVITNPTHYAVALKYDPAEMAAPLCVAKGVDNIALKIREIAKDSGVEIVENPPLARTLHAVVDVDEAIPPEQYNAVAEIISYVFKRKGKL